jgi:hypothetical protein
MFTFIYNRAQAGLACGPRILTFFLYLSDVEEVRIHRNTYLYIYVYIRLYMYRSKYVNLCRLLNVWNVS